MSLRMKENIFFRATLSLFDGFQGYKSIIFTFYFIFFSTLVTCLEVLIIALFSLFVSKISSLEEQLNFESGIMGLLQTPSVVDNLPIIVIILLITTFILKIRLFSNTYKI